MATKGFVQAKRAIPGQASQLNKIFDEPEDYDSEDEEHVALRAKADAAINQGRALLGGQDINNNEDRWMSNAQRQQMGISDGVKSKKTKKLKPGPVQEISPITGEYLCDFPTSNWVEKFKSNLPPAPKPVVKPRQTLTEADQRLLKFFKSQLASRGSKGFIGIQRKFRIMDDDNSGSLDIQEFEKAMKESGLQCTKAELERLFKYFDADGSGTIDFEEFLFAMRGQMNDRRKRLVNMAFDVMDKDGNGFLEPADVIDTYDASKHPDVMSGKSSPEKVLTEFLDTFDVGGEKDGVVTRNEFENYYANISASIENEDYFELMIRNAWHIAGGEGQAANSTNRRVRAVGKDGKERIVTVENDLGIKYNNQKGIEEALRKQGIDFKSIDLKGGVEDDDNNPGVVVTATSNIPVKYLNNAQPSASDTTANYTGTKATPPNLPKGSKPQPLRAKGGAATSKKEAQYKEEALPNPLVDKLQGRLKKRGVKGFVGLQRIFRNMDDDGNRQLDKEEFKKGMKDLRMKLTDLECNSLFKFFDRDSSGTIDFDEFMVGVRGQMAPRRLKFVHMAFDIMDKDGNGFLEPADVIGTYDASQHPEVIAGRKSTEEVLTEFLDNFDVGGEKDGVVTRNEFENYYANISASIDDDDYFELMMRNAWHIAGGEGQAANSTNKRVMVRQADGSERIETVQNDLGLRSNDKNALGNALRKQGVQFESMDIKGGDGVDDDKRDVKGKAPPRVLVGNQSAAPTLGELRQDTDDLRRKGAMFIAQTRYQEAEVELSKALQLLLLHFGDQKDDIKAVQTNLKQCHCKLLGI